MSVRISGAELDALSGESDELFRLYIGALRPRMDFKTGVVGRRVRLSYQALKEWTERAARPGVKYLSHDKSKLQRMLARLQAIGLLRRMGRAGDLVFACPLADRDSTDPKQADTKSIQVKSAAKPRRSKGARDFSTNGENAKAATHPASGKTNTPPNPPRGLEAVDPAPHAYGAGGEPDPQHHQPASVSSEVDLQQSATDGEKDINPPPHADGAGGELDPQHRTGTQQLSEERHEPVNVGGMGPSARLAEGGVGISWREDLAWPVGLAPEQRAYLAQSLQPLGETLAQRVLDEWRGAMRSIRVEDPWAYLHTLLRNAKEKGEAWQTVYAEKIALARQKVAQTMARQQADHAAFKASIGGAPGYPGADALRLALRKGGAR